MIQKLLSHDAKSDVVDSKGCTPFAVATMHGHGTRVTALLQHDDKLEGKFVEQCKDKHRGQSQYEQDQNKNHATDHQNNPSTNEQNNHQHSHAEGLTNNRTTEDILEGTSGTEIVEFVVPHIAECTKL